jgi:hypothetical protein
MDPRPFYSQQLRRRVFQRIESETRWRVKNLLIRRFPTEQQMGEREYAGNLQRLVEELSVRGCRTLIISHVDIDERWFPGSASTLTRYAEIGADVARGCEVGHMSSRGVVNRWQDFAVDHFHFNDAGHAQMAKSISESGLFHR